MNTDEIRSLLLGGTLEPPYTIVAVDGRAYAVTDRRNVFLPGAYPDAVIVAIPGKGIAILRSEMIDCIACAGREFGAGGGE
jgi:hypothetical protein